MSPATTGSLVTEEWITTPGPRIGRNISRNGRTGKIVAIIHSSITYAVVTVEVKEQPQK